MIFDTTLSEVAEELSAGIDISNSEIEGEISQAVEIIGGFIESTLPEIEGLSADIGEDITEIEGTISSGVDVVGGSIDVEMSYNHYTGTYEVSPRNCCQYISTKDKVMDKDFEVKEIPLYEVSNVQGGLTLVIE